MKVLFYLPVVTPWWLENIVSPIIGAIEKDCDVSAIVPSSWKGTGVGARHPVLRKHAGVDWYHLEGEAYQVLRAGAEEVPSLLDLVCDIDADYTFCRSADTLTPEFFPGTVRYLMEYELPPLPPLAMGHDFALSGPKLFDRGFLPPLSPAMRSWLFEAANRCFDADPRARALCARRPSRADYCAAAGLPEDKALIAFPLEYEFPENFFSKFRRYCDNVAAMEAALSCMGNDCCLAVTRHPLNRRHGGDEAVVEFIAAHAPRVVEVTCATAGQATAELIRQCDGVILEDTKCVYLAALFGKPMLHVSGFSCAEWMNAYTDPAAFFAAVAQRDARHPAEEDALVWFGYGLANDRINPHLPGFGWASLRACADRPYDPRRWQGTVDFYAAHMWQGYAAAAGDGA